MEEGEAAVPCGVTESVGLADVTCAETHWHLWHNYRLMPARNPVVWKSINDGYQNRVGRGCMELGLIQRHLAYSGGVPDSTSPALKPNPTKQAHNKLNKNGRNTSLPRTLRKHLGCPFFQPSLKAHTVFQSPYLTKCISFTNEVTEKVVQPLLSGGHYLIIRL